MRIPEPEPAPEPEPPPEPQPSPGAREFYMLFDAKYTNFSEVHQEVTSPVYLPCISPETLILSSYPYP